MCLLAVLFQVHPDGPLVVAANRDEWLARPAGTVRVLRDTPQILGGRDEEAGGTWLAVNEAGVLAALTNQPAAREPGRKSRGELPLLLCGHSSAASAAQAFVTEVRCEDYSPCWLLVGDREALYYLVLEGRGAPAVEPLEPGVHVLENRPLRPRSGKASRIEATLVAAPGWRGDDLVRGLAGVLGDHERPEAGEAGRPEQVEAACVHAGPYGTRSSSIVVVPPLGHPRVYAADGAPCVADFSERDLWT